MKRLDLTPISATATRVIPNRWDVVAFVLIFSVLALLVQGGIDMQTPLATIENKPISLEPSALPGYALQTIIRMLSAMGFSLLFTFAYATLAAKSKRAELVMIPLLDILQSVPVLGFISFTLAFFLNLFPGNSLGVECAAVFAIFTSMAWNMTFSLYQSLRTVPRDLDEVSRSYHFSGWQRFWRLEVPFAMPGLIWNAMMSMSGGWFFVVASEAITVGDKTITLPGVGSYVATAIAQHDLGSIGWALGAMLVVILIYDQILFRPLVIWSERFRVHDSETSLESHSWVLTMIKRSRLIDWVMRPLRCLARWSLSIRIPLSLPMLPKLTPSSRLLDALWIATIIGATLIGGWNLYKYLSQYLQLSDTLHAILLTFYTLLRVVILIFLASLFWVPVGIWIGLKPGLAEKIQPVAQFLAAFPANLVFPLAVMMIVRFDLNPNIWLSPLIVFGTQWYILFNVIAGASSFPRDLQEVADNMQLSGWLWWRRVMLPGIFPYYITGAITASGGSWNASIVAEMVQWGNTTLTADGIGAYIAQATASGDFPRIVLGITLMCGCVLLFNRLFWRRLYLFSEKRLRLD
ncbi:MAG: ABC transporter permease subunit [Rickettsiales bacterium]|nr:ABC transporter permease subunit [Rickettsiales bacterium]